MSFNNMCKKTSSGRIAKNKNCPCCMAQNNPNTERPAHKKKAGPPKCATLLQQEKSESETQQPKRKLDEPSTSGIKKAEKKKPRLQEDEAKKPLTLRNETEAENIIDLTESDIEDSDDSPNFRIYLFRFFGRKKKDVKKDEHSKWPACLEKKPLTLRNETEAENIIDLTMSEIEDSDDSHEMFADLNKKNVQNKSDKKMTEDPEYNGQINADIALINNLVEGVNVNDNNISSDKILEMQQDNQNNNETSPIKKERETDNEIPFLEVTSNEVLLPKLYSDDLIQDAESQSNELTQERVPEQNNDQDNKTSEQDDQGASCCQSNEQNHNQNDDQGGSDSQSNEQNLNQNDNISESVENGAENSPDELKTKVNDEDIDNHHFNINPSSSNSIVSMALLRNKNFCCKHFQRIKILYITDQRESVFNKSEIKLKLDSLQSEVNEEAEPKPGFSGVEVEKKEDVKVESKEEMKHMEKENGMETEIVETDHVLDPNEYVSAPRFLEASKIPSLKINTLQDQPCNVLVQVGDTETSDESERQRLFQQEVREGRVEIYAENNVSADDMEEHFCMCGEKILRTRYIFLNDEDRMLSHEQILDRYWYWQD